MRYWAKAVVGLPYYAKNSVIGAPAHGRHLFFQDENAAHVVCGILNSSLFYLYFITFGDCFHLSHNLVTSFLVPDSLLRETRLASLDKTLMTELRYNAEVRSIQTRDGDTITYEEFYGGKSKDRLDEVDRSIAVHYGFTDEELDFIVNYDIKYRMGHELFDEEGGEQE